ncbi:MAG: hypothetical protein HY700_01885 [Gemmatimonadetes bacterium]|nr:hypothetical protein [Gemmatimonadota bacterium]
MTEPVEPPKGMGFSFPLGIPLLLHPLLLIGMVVGRGKWWVYLLHSVYFGVIGVFFWTAVSRAQWERMRAKVPTLTRANWVLNWMIFFVVLPLLLWVFFGLRTLIRKN